MHSFIRILALVLALWITLVGLALIRLGFIFEGNTTGGSIVDAAIAVLVIPYAVLRTLQIAWRQADGSALSRESDLQRRSD